MLRLVPSCVVGSPFGGPPSAGLRLDKNIVTLTVRFAQASLTVIAIKSDTVQSEARLTIKAALHMMKLKRGEHLVLGLTDENLIELVNGKALRVRGDEVTIPGVTIYILHGGSHEEMRQRLQRSGYEIPRHDGGDGSEH